MRIRGHSQVEVCSHVDVGCFVKVSSGNDLGEEAAEVWFSKVG